MWLVATLIVSMAAPDEPRVGRSERRLLKRLQEAYDWAGTRENAAWRKLLGASDIPDEMPGLRYAVQIHCSRARMMHMDTLGSLIRVRDSGAVDAHVLWAERSGFGEPVSMRAQLADLHEKHRRDPLDRLLLRVKLKTANIASSTAPRLRTLIDQYERLRLAPHPPDDGNPPGTVTLFTDAGGYCRLEAWNPHSSLSASFNLFDYVSTETPPLLQWMEDLRDVLFEAATAAEARR